MILGKIAEADGLILASPVYSHMVSAMIKNVFERFGFNLAPSLELQFRPGKMPEKNTVMNIEKIDRREKNKPSLKMIISYNIFKYASKLDKDKDENQEL